MANTTTTPSSYGNADASDVFNKDDGSGLNLVISSTTATAGVSYLPGNGYDGNDDGNDDVDVAVLNMT